MPMKKPQRKTFIFAFFSIASIFLFFPEWVSPCTSFVLHSNGVLLFGSNFDNSIWEGILYINKKNVRKTGWETGTTGEVAKWTSKYGSVTFNSAGYQLPWAGMNEEGLVISTMALEETENPSPDERPPLVSSFWMQYILDTCATVDDIIASDKIVRIQDTVDHYLVCDRNGECATLEYLGGKLVYHKKETLTAKALTNLPYAVCAEAWKKGPSPELPRYHSVARFSRVADKLKAYNANDSGDAADYAFIILGDVASRATNWSIVFDIKKRIIRYVSLRNKRVRSIDFSKIDFSCRSPVKMLDVHTDLEGDITEKFQDFDQAASLEHIKRAIKNYGIDVTEEMINQVFEMVTRFPCLSNKR
jgi:penicillin V acylase-like amidase (Ntn superfamily)